MTIVYIRYGLKREQALNFRSSRIARLGYGFLTFATAGMFVFGADLVARRVTGYVNQGMEQLFVRGARIP
jgi:hypothetical protein